ncbi:Outer membrane protein OmpA [Moraxella cuniculi DSM 21768]|uniref:Outer membrane protein OmpA n=1 Tax=Moraxella cuniculi DSM 21768 TaxID=1122245 RepID=A0A1N7FNT0_9GAMM|nr:OmpA family protein [Moraxella cuniculi]OOS04732.1 cell envelope biogenesis protein OmpA [Moraxella cuniculi]SIS02012.1 Outer membrane protein OmpA [Moraxella cuniculi DSM 21768]
MSLISKLHELITPHVLAAIKNQDGDNASKSNLLETFYAIFAARLSNDDVYQRVATLPENELGYGHHLLKIAFGTDDEQGITLSDKLGQEFGLSTVSAHTAIATAAPLVVARLKELAGTTAVPAFLRNQLANEQSRLPAWAYALLPAGLFAAGTAAANTATAEAPVAAVATPVSKPEPQAAHVNTAAEKHYEKEKSSFLKTILPIIGLLIFAGLAWLLLRACQEKPAPVAAPVSETAAPAADTADTGAVAAAPATLSLSVDETGKAIYSCRTQVGNEQLAGQVRAAVAQVFGTENCSAETTNTHATTMPAAEYLPAILGLMKDMPSSSVAINGQTVRFNAASPEHITHLVDGAKGILPADFTIEAEPVLDIQTAVASSIESARTAISGLGEGAEVSVDDLVRALNLQIINFATDSSDIPAENKEILDLAAAKLASLPAATLRIIGHTDNQGSDEYNQKLSESRAAAVRDYLVSKGVPAERLSVKGASFSEPVASNATEQGRFQNRRIEFTVLKEGEQVAAVGNADNSEATATEQAQKADADKK